MSIVSGGSRLRVLGSECNPAPLAVLLGGRGTAWGRKQGVVSGKDLCGASLLHNLFVRFCGMARLTSNISSWLRWRAPTVETLTLDDRGRSFGGNWDARRLHRWSHIRVACPARPAQGQHLNCISQIILLCILEKVLTP